MKFVSILVIGMLVLAGQVYGADESALKSEKDKLSYTFGANFGKGMKQQEIEINTDIFVKGMKDGFSGEKMLLTDQEMKDTMTAFQKEMAAKQAEKEKPWATRTKKKEMLFLQRT